MRNIDAFEVVVDPTRRRIIEALADGGKAVNDVVAMVDIHQSGVSRHLRILHDAGFVAVRAEGQKRVYALRPEPFRELDAWVARYRSLWEGRLGAFAQELDRRQAARAGTETGGAS